MRSIFPPHLGDLELTVLGHLWTEGPEDAKAVHLAVGCPRAITLNTIQSTLKRLHEKGFLSREKVSHAYVYAPKIGREEFRRQVLREVVELVMNGESESMLTTFVDLTDRAGPGQLERLERIVEARLKDREDESE